MINFFYNGAPVAWEFFVRSLGSVLAFWIFMGIIMTFILLPLVITAYSIYLFHKILKKKFKNLINDDFYYISALYGTILVYGISIILLQSIPFIGFFVSIIVLLFTLKIRDGLNSLSWFIWILCIFYKKEGLWLFESKTLFLIVSMDRSSIS